MCASTDAGSQPRKLCETVEKWDKEVRYASCCARCRSSGCCVLLCPLGHRLGRCGMREELLTHLAAIVEGFRTETIKNPLWID
eukprot:2471154-Amphidinium_carterae.1